MASESRAWFEKGIFELGIAQAHLLSGMASQGAQHARQAALKFLQAAIVKSGEAEPSPRIADLTRAASAACPGFQAEARWNSLDQIAGNDKIGQEEAKVVYATVESIRDEVARVIG